MAEKEKAAGKQKGKAGGGKEGKGSKAAGAGADGGLSLARHPRAVRAVARAKGWGALAGFLLGGYLSLPTHTLADAGFRALLAGIVCYVAVWAAAVFVWRRLVVAELRGAEQELLLEAATDWGDARSARIPKSAGAEGAGRPAVE